MTFPAARVAASQHHQDLGLQGGRQLGSRLAWFWGGPPTRAPGPQGSGMMAPGLQPSQCPLA